MSLPPTLLKKGMVKDDNDQVLNPYQKSVDYVIECITKEKEITKPGDKFWLLRSDTGSGKSTILPPYLRRAIKGNHKMMICTQPRIFNTLDIPEQIAKYNNDFVIGENLGFSTSIRKVVIKGEGLMFVTIDTLLNQLKNWPDERFLKTYSHIFIDEVHVRNIGLDILFYKLKIMISKNYTNSMCPTIIMMSATFDVPKFSNFFGTTNMLKIVGSTYPIQHHFLDAPASDPNAQIVKQIIEIHKNNPDPEPLRDILVFIYGASMGQKIKDLIEEANVKIEVILIMSNVLDEAKKNISKLTNVRRVFLGTNAVETGVTIDTLKYVIEPGWALISEYNPVTNSKSLLVRSIDRGAVTQRSGRVGRKAPGVCYHIYTEETFNLMPLSGLPEILTNDVSDALMYIFIDRFEMRYNTLKDIIDKRDRQAEAQLLLIKKGEKSSSLDFVDMLDNPAGESIARGMELLHQIGAIDNDNIPTITGLMMNMFSRLPMEARKTILSCSVFEVSFNDINIMMWMMTMSNELKKDRKLFDGYMRYDLFKDLKWGEKFYPLVMDKCFDYLLLYIVFQRKLKKDGIRLLKKWCVKIGLNYKGMINVIALAFDTNKTCDSIGYNYDSTLLYSFKKEIKLYNKTDDYKRYIEFIKRFKLCVYQGFKKNMAIYQGMGYQTPNGKYLQLKVPGNPKHVLFYQGILQEREGKIRYNINEYSVMSGFVGCDDHFY